MDLESVLRGIDLLVEARGGVKDKKRGTNRKKPINRSAMYKHMVVAIYDKIKDTGYAYGTDAEAARKIARGNMVKYGYAKRRKNRRSKKGKADRRQIKLTSKGKRRSRKHANEPSGDIATKNKKFAKISAMK